MNAMPATVALCGSSRRSTRQPRLHTDATADIMVTITATMGITTATTDITTTAIIPVHPTLPTLPNMEGSMEGSMGEGVACRLASRTAI